LFLDQGDLFLARREPRHGKIVFIARVQEGQTIIARRGNATLEVLETGRNLTRSRFRRVGRLMLDTLGTRISRVSFH
jgi:hypothetical protein